MNSFLTVQPGKRLPGSDLMCISAATAPVSALRGLRGEVHRKDMRGHSPPCTAGAWARTPHCW